jgi:enoyl-CoA hydratase/carnithine racemase
MRDFRATTMSWGLRNGCVELALHRPPYNEIGSESLVEFERFIAELETVFGSAHALIIHSELGPGFCAGADLRELFRRSQEVAPDARLTELREFLQRILLRTRWRGFVFRNCAWD